MHPERTDDLKAKIKQLAYIDHISYQLALVKIYSVFLIRSSRTHRTNPDDDNVKKIETATINLLDLCSMEGLDDNKNLLALVTKGIYKIMKVKIFNEYGYYNFPLEDRINDFIQDKKVIDIKYQTNYSDNNALLKTALVMYE